MPFLVHKVRHDDCLLNKYTCALFATHAHQFLQRYAYGKCINGATDALHHSLSVVCAYGAVTCCVLKMCMIPVQAIAVDSTRIGLDAQPHDVQWSQHPQHLSCNVSRRSQAFTMLMHTHQCTIYMSVVCTPATIHMISVTTCAASAMPVAVDLAWT